MSWVEPAVAAIPAELRTVRGFIAFVTFVLIVRVILGGLRVSHTEALVPGGPPRTSRALWGERVAVIVVFLVSAGILYAVVAPRAGG